MQGKETHDHCRILRKENVVNSIDTRVENIIMWRIFFYALIWLKILITFRERCDYLAGISGFRGRIAFTLCWSPSCSPSCFQGLCLEGCKIIKGKQNSKLWFWTKFLLSYTNDRYHCHCWYEYYYYYYYFDDRYHNLRILLRKTGPLWLKKTRTTS